MIKAQFIILVIVIGPTSDHNAGSKRLLAYIMCIHFGVSRTILKVVCLCIPFLSQTPNVYNVHLEDDLKYYNQRLKKMVQSVSPLR